MLANLSGRLSRRRRTMPIADDHDFARPAHDRRFPLKLYHSPICSTMLTIAVIVCGILLLTSSPPLWSLTMGYDAIGKGSGQTSPKIICVGDSLTAGYYNAAPQNIARLIVFHPYALALTKALNGKASAIPIGFSGWRTEDLLDTADVYTRAPSNPEDAAPQPGIAAAIRKYRPMLAIIMIGTNDIFRAPSLEELDGRAIAKRAWRLHAVAHRANVKTVAMGIPEWSSTRRKAAAPFTNELRVKTRSELNSALREYCGNSSEMAFYIDFPFRYSEDTGHWTSDGLHFTPQGSDSAGFRIAEILRDKIPELRD